MRQKSGAALALQAVWPLGPYINSCGVARRETDEKRGPRGCTAGGLV